MLKNVPEKQIDDALRQKARKHKAGLVRDVIECTRGIQGLEKAVTYFVGNKVLCDDFNQAEQLIKLKVKEVITLEGTQFKEGTISGGEHKFANVQLGKAKNDKYIAQLINEVKSL